mmetsp:Transcript_117910/g.241023  ORF Transcript_117910/g.241023 Transcript_117910/m.241023 type:complete len:268 (+) Transcript_117910:342-1145(+)
MAVAMVCVVRPIAMARFRNCCRDVVCCSCCGGRKTKDSNVACGSRCRPFQFHTGCLVVGFRGSLSPSRSFAVVFGCRFQPTVRIRISKLCWCFIGVVVVARVAAGSILVARASCGVFNGYRCCRWWFVCFQSLFGFRSRVAELPTGPASLARSRRHFIADRVLLFAICLCIIAIGIVFLVTTVAIVVTGERLAAHFRFRCLPPLAFVVGLVFGSEATFGRVRRVFPTIVFLLFGKGSLTACRGFRFLAGVLGVSLARAAASSSRRRR